MNTCMRLRPFPCMHDQPISSPKAPWKICRALSTEVWLPGQHSASCSESAEAQGGRVGQHSCWHRLRLQHSSMRVAGHLARRVVPALFSGRCTGTQNKVPQHAPPAGRPSHSLRQLVV